jgi:hypothetical protein
VEGRAGGDRLVDLIAQAAQIVGALLILAAYVLAQFGVLDQRSYWYLWLNLVGAAALTVLAWHERQWGFLILEGVWTVVTAWSLVQGMRFSSQRGLSQ